MSPSLPCGRLQRCLWLIAVIAVMLVVAASAWSGVQAQKVARQPGGYAFPPLTGRIVDQADLLSELDEAALTRQLATLDHDTGHQLVIATVNDLSGHSIEDYSLRLANYWGVGRKSIDDGVVLLVAPHERKVRIEVGYGLEKVVTNDEAARIIDTDILPQFRGGRMAKGVERGAEALIADLSRTTT